MLARLGPSLVVASLARVGCQPVHDSEAPGVEPTSLPSTHAFERGAQMCLQARACEAAMGTPPEDDHADDPERCRTRLAVAAARAAMLHAYADPRWSPPYPAACVEPTSSEPSSPVEAGLAPAVDSLRQHCRAVFAFAIDRAGHAPLHLHSPTPRCRSSIADLVEAPNVRPAGATARRRGACPGPRCGPREGTSIVVDPVGATAPGCFDVWTYYATGGGHERVCLDGDRIRTTVLGVVY